MKPLLITTALAFALVSSGQTQQIETYNAGTYAEIFHTNATPYFSLSNGQGFLDTRGIQPANTMYTLNYLRKGPFNLSTANSTIEMTTMFKVVKPTSTNLGVSTLHVGFCKDQSVTAFISSGSSGDICYMISPKSLVDTGNGFYFDSSLYASVYNGSSSAGFGFGTAGSFILKSNNWYKATLRITRVNSTTLSLLGEIDDYGVDGQTYMGWVDYNNWGSATGNATYPFTPPALHGMSSGGLKVADQTIITGQLSPDFAADISLVAKLDFATQGGIRYFINSSSDLTNWTTIEGPINGGGLLTRYYPATGSARYFRVTQE